MSARPPVTESAASTNGSAASTPVQNSVLPSEVVHSADGIAATYPASDPRTIFVMRSSIPPPSTAEQSSRQDNFGLQPGSANLERADLADHRSSFIDDDDFSAAQSLALGIAAAPTSSYEQSQPGFRQNARLPSPTALLVASQLNVQGEAAATQTARPYSRYQSPSLGSHPAPVGAQPQTFLVDGNTGDPVSPTRPDSPRPWSSQELSLQSIPSPGARPQEKDYLRILRDAIRHVRLQVRIRKIVDFWRLLVTVDTYAPPGPMVEQSVEWSGNAQTFTDEGYQSLEKSKRPVHGDEDDLESKTGSVRTDYQDSGLAADVKTKLVSLFAEELVENLGVIEKPGKERDIVGRISADTLATVLKAFSLLVGCRAHAGLEVQATVFVRHQRR